MNHSKLVNVGFGNMVVASRIVAIVAPSSAPMKRLKEEARQHGKLIDATQGRKTRAIIITDSDHVILSAVQTITVAQRLADDEEDAPVLLENEGDEV
jgi:extracellular matrix regulatory protein A